MKSGEGGLATVENMSGALSSNVAKSLRQVTADVISNEKAYDVPGICRRLGLSDGNSEEAFRSKYRYAHGRLVEIGDEKLVGIARTLALEYDDYRLLEQIALIDEVGSPAVTKLTRRRLIALFDGRSLATEMDDLELIRGIWPISKMPAPIQGQDHTLEDDIVRYTVQNDDLSQKEVLEHLGLLTCSRAQLFKFIVGVTSPEAQSPAVQAELAAKVDALLRLDGYALVVAGRVSGSPFYMVQPVPMGSPSDESITAALTAFDVAQVTERWSAAMERRGSDPAGAITLARTLLEDVCKWILDAAGETWQESDDLPALYRKLAKTLKLAPDDHTEQVFKQILGSCQSVVESLGALRNKLSDAHSPGPKRARPQPRHAQLAVDLAGAMAVFLVSTWEARQADAPVKVDDHFLEALKSSLRLSDVVGRKVKLRKQGREYVGQSPFSEESTPCFYVNDEKGFYHCFSSGKHGDLISFLRETEGVAFDEVVRRLAAENQDVLPAD